MDRPAVLAAVCLFALVSLGLNVTSSGFLEADGITHYLYARWALAEPHLLTNVWGRPVVTILHALPAQLPGTFLGQPWGLIGVRAMSMLLAIGAALVTWRVAAGQGSEHGHDRPGVAAIFLLCMPLVVLHSISELTELPFAFLAISALRAYQHRRWWLLALLAGLLPAARPEGFGFALMAAGGLLLHRRWLALLLVPLPLIVWDRVGWWQYGNVAPGQWWELFRWLRENWPYSEESTYQSGPLLKFVGMLPSVVGPMIMPFVIIGVVASFSRRDADTRRPAASGTADAVVPAPGDEGTLAYASRDTPAPARSGGWRDHGTRVAWLVAFLPLFVLAVHSVLHWLGKMASSGDVRYLVSVAPFWALLGARGWDWLSRRFEWRFNYLPAAAAGVLPLVIMQIAYPIVPLESDQPGREAQGVARWYERSDWSRSHPRLLTDHPIVWLTLDINPQAGGGGKERIMQAPPGTVFLWHEIYSTHNADDRFVVPAEVPAMHGWRDVTPADLPEGWRVFATEPG